MRKFVACFCVAAGVRASVSARSVQRPATEVFDILSRQARVMDGMGNPWVRADVGVRGGRIAAAGKLDGAFGHRQCGPVMQPRCQSKTWRNTKEGRTITDRAITRFPDYQFPD